MSESSKNGTGVQQDEDSVNSPGPQCAPSSEPEKSPETPSDDAQETQLDPSKVEYVDGKCFYTDPNTGTKLEWNETAKQWAPVEDLSKNYEVKDGCYYYTDSNSGVRYKWNTGTNNWDVTDAATHKGDENDDDSEEFDEDDDTVDKKVKKNVARQDMSDGIYGMDGDNRTYTDPKDGTVYVWDVKKNAWFPKVDDDFLAQYQMNYGFTDSSQTQEVPDTIEAKVEAKSEPQPEKPSVSEKPSDSEKPQAVKRKQPDPPTWFDIDEKDNTKVYVSNLPLDITDQEFLDLMQKCGLVMKDLDTGKMKIKLYTERGSSTLKGDGLCTYIKVESVQLALNLLDGYEFKGKKIKVERAKFTMKGSSYDPSLKPKKKKKKALEKMKKIQEKLFDWRPDKMRGERARNERVVIVKNLFEPSVFDKDASLILEYQQDLREECMKCGDLRKVIVHDRHPEGVAQIMFKEAEAADACVQLLNGRWFGKRKIEAATWDGKTKYKIHETEEEIEARIKKWDSYLESEEDKEKESEGGNGSAKDNVAAESDNDTRSSAGSGDETD
uniref:17S U2 SnRNP complex component HTATSF1 n=1 Tax=Lygus hesperus TaxID=30085 RepID=A0A0K8SSD9_LYGHE